MPAKPSIEHLRIDHLVPYARNSRTHSAAQIAQIADSIREFGFTSPVLIDGTGSIIAGHGRVMAAQQLALKEVPCLRLPHLTDAQKRAYIIADNKIALNAGWDEAMLLSELDDLADLDIDARLLGFSDDELGFTPAAEDSKTATVAEISTRPVFDRFWISIRGPLQHQAIALQRLQALMAEMPLDIELGTVTINGLD